ncbi:BCD family MFS transporter [Roseospira visakhapatnamensis]|uniref:BCD family chlorophyll transporter-like MFS transporter n=1 Tax=Roseospira visakhapatnamensis TaxID=390880 RepID=A0A7W6RFZ7_9PROT|nr:BCD family MFS transporter [Roseospira visakhapatnamensis]MBB4267193.1 BCD family chlorophyll transporter-like MFS transporter [Roseospira visakhapatnamensis]
MTAPTPPLIKVLMEAAPRYLPFADAATDQLPLGRLLRLSLFQVSVGMATVLLTGTLNRVMIVEMGVPAWLVAVMVSLPLVFAPFRVLIGYRSDTHKSLLGWRRVPYIWFGTLLQFAGLAVMPFALLVLARDGGAVGQLGAAVAFLLVGAGLHTTQTAGLALANDLAPPEARPRVVALLYVMLLLGMVGSALTFGVVLEDFGQKRLIQVIQGAAAVTMALNLVALWKQEPRNRTLTDPARPRPRFGEAWAAFTAGGRYGRLLVVVGLGTAAFTMQDILLEPYGGEVLGLSVSATTVLTALLAGGTLVGFAMAARWLSRGHSPYRLAAVGVVVGLVAFSCVIFAAPLTSPLLFRVGAVFIGLGGGLFVVGTLTAAMDMADSDHGGLALGAWGGVQATATGIAIALGGAIRDGVSALSERGVLGETLQAQGPSVGYGVVYHIEIGLLLLTLVAVGPLVRSTRDRYTRAKKRFGMAEFPG